MPIYDAIKIYETCIYGNIKVTIHKGPHLHHWQSTRKKIRGIHVTIACALVGSWWRLLFQLHPLTLGERDFCGFRCGADVICAVWLKRRRNSSWSWWRNSNRPFILHYLDLFFGNNTIWTLISVWALPYTPMWNPLPISASTGAHSYWCPCCWPHRPLSSPNPHRRSRSYWLVTADLTHHL
jgi:hypothetical protein